MLMGGMGADPTVDFVVSLYRSILGREPEPGAAEFWAKTANESGWSFATLQAQFMKSANVELASRPAPVVQAPAPVQSVTTAPPYAQAAPAVQALLNNVLQSRDSAAQSQAQDMAPVQMEPAGGDALTKNLPMIGIGLGALYFLTRKKRAQG